MERNNRTELRREPVIVIIDDDKSILPLLKGIITHFRRGLSIYPFGTSEDALVFLYEQKASLLFTDLMGDTIVPFPDFREVLAKTLNAHIPVVRMSANAILRNTDAEGSVAFLNKPFDIDQVGSLLEKYLPLPRDER